MKGETGSSLRGGRGPCVGELLPQWRQMFGTELFFFGDMISSSLLQFQSSSSGECALMLFHWIFPNSKIWHCPLILLFWMCIFLNYYYAGGCSKASAGTKQWSCSCVLITRMEPSWFESQRQAEVRGFYCFLFFIPPLLIVRFIITIQSEANVMLGTLKFLHLKLHFPLA